MGNEKKDASEQLFKRLSEDLDSLSDAVEHTCPSCAHINDEGAAYCSECGSVLKESLHCPKCNAASLSGGDICENCGTWLLKGQCVFCYADIEENVNYCGECGNPPNGITCSQCGALSIFDFCAKCSIPLSIQAKAMAYENAKDPAFQEVVSLFREAFAENSSAVTHEVDMSPLERELTKRNKQEEHESQLLKAYRDSVDQVSTHQKTITVRKGIFSKEQICSINHLNEAIAKEEERLRQAKEQLEKAMRSLSGKTFTTNQDARRYFMSLVAGLPEDIAQTIINNGLRWRCNAYDCTHNLPSECAAPERGGVWLIG